MINLERKLDERLVRVNPISPFSEHGPPHRNGLSDPALPRPRISGPIGHDGHGHDLDDASQIQWESRNRPAVMLIPENSVEPEEFEEQLAALPDQSRTLSLVNSPTSRRTSRAQGMANPDFLIREGKGRSMLQSVLERRLFRDATTVGCRLRHLPRTTLGPRTAAHRRSHPVYESRRRRTGSAPRHGH